MNYQEIDETAPRSKQPEALSIKLKPHQLATLHALRQIEKDGKIVIPKDKFTNKNKEEEVHVINGEDPEQQLVRHDFGNAPRMNDLEKDQDKLRENSMGNFIKRMIRYSADDVNDNDDLDDSLLGELILRTSSVILGSPTGSGKTYMILGFIAMNKTPNLHSRIVQGSSNFCLEMENNQKCVNCNLIIVPTSLFSQWKEFMSKLKMVKYFINTNKDLEKFYDPEILEDPASVKDDDRIKLNRFWHKLIRHEKKITKVLNKCDVILLNFARYAVFKKVFKSIYWKRLIIDEAHSIKLGHSFQEIGAFNIFVTATPGAIMQGTQRRYINKLFGSDMNIFDQFIIKNTEEFIGQSMKVPKPDVYFIHAKIPMMIQEFEGHIPPEVMNMINAGNYKEAINRLNGNIDTQDNIFEVLKRETKKALHNLKQDKIAIQNRLMEEDKKEEELSKIDEKIETLVDKLADLKDRMEKIKTSCCSICYDIYKLPSITSCCRQIYCFSCLSNCVTNQQKCPNCRKNFTLKNFTLIDDGTNVKKSKGKQKVVIDPFSSMDKTDILDKLLTYIASNNEHPRILIFSDYSETFDKILHLVTRVGLRFSKLEGTPAHIDNVISDYTEGVVNILLLNSKKFGAGFNLQCTDFIIAYHRTDEYIEEQVVARGQRYGRKEKLKLFFLINSNEPSYCDHRKNIITLESESDLHKIEEEVPNTDDEDEEEEKPKKKKKNKGKRDTDD
jgi:hypothetical protein